MAALVHDSHTSCLGRFTGRRQRIACIHESAAKHRRTCSRLLRTTTLSACRPTPVSLTLMRACFWLVVALMLMWPFSVCRVA